jgi:hypothetical protein
MQSYVADAGHAMKRAVLPLALIIFTLCLSGCIQSPVSPEPDFITVHIDLSCTVGAFLDVNKSLFVTIPYTDIKIDMIADGQEPITINKTTNGLGWIGGISGVFQLYENQNITCAATLLSEPPPKYANHTFPVATVITRWEAINESADFGEETTIHPKLHLSGIIQE